jgi:hypothetical protein
MVGWPNKNGPVTKGVLVARLAAERWFCLGCTFSFCYLILFIHVCFRGAASQITHGLFSGMAQLAAQRRGLLHSSL